MIMKEILYYLRAKLYTALNAKKLLPVKLRGTDCYKLLPAIQADADNNQIKSNKLFFYSQNVV